jgi:hypothetical protein
LIAADPEVHPANVTTPPELTTVEAAPAPPALAAGKIEARVILAYGPVYVGSTIVVPVLAEVETVVLRHA